MDKYQGMPLLIICDDFAESFKWIPELEPSGITDYNIVTSPEVPITYERFQIDLIIIVGDINQKVYDYLVNQEVIPMVYVVNAIFTVQEVKNIQKLNAEVEALPATPTEIQTILSAAVKKLKTGK